MLDPGIVDGLKRGVVQQPGHIDSADLRPQWATTGDHERVGLGHEGHRASLLRRLHAVTAGAVRRPGFAPRDAALEVGPPVLDLDRQKGDLADEVRDESCLRALVPSGAACYDEDVSVVLAAMLRAGWFLASRPGVFRSWRGLRPRLLSGGRSGRGAPPPSR